MGITEVHVHCYKSNQASARMIVACGGRLDSEGEVGDEVVQRYVVEKLVKGGELGIASFDQ